jgi:AcrR family transcriptional regulator
LIEAAIELFAEQGYDATSTGAIAERAGYSRSLVNVRYGSKEALLDSLLRSELEDRLLAATAGEADGLTRMLSPIDRILTLLHEDEQLLRAFLTLMFEAVGPVRTLRPHVTGWLARLEEATLQAIDAGRADGSIRSDTDVRAAVSELATFSIGIVYRWLLEESYDLAGELESWRERLRSRLSP